MHHITAYGGRTKSPAPFQKAILQSPGWEPSVSNEQQEKAFTQYLSLLNVTTVAEARRLPFSTLQTANIVQVGGAGTAGFGPTVDGDYVPALPGQLLLHGQFEKSIEVMVGHNSDEGLIFSSPFVQTTLLSSRR